MSTNSSLFSPCVFLWSMILLCNLFSYPTEVHSTVLDPTSLGPLSLISKDRISTNPVCQAELSRICAKRSENLPDFDALECILGQKRNEVEELSPECNHALWEYRKSITDESGFKQLLETQTLCMDDYQKSGCWNTSIITQSGFTLVNCLIENKDKLEMPKCQTFVTRMEGVIFADYEIIARFASKCEQDIKTFKCGRNDFGQQSLAQKLPNSQGKTIECLSDHIQNLKDQCAVEILRIAELQVDDFHLDRALYFACRDDREKFCGRVQAGNGRVYKCLLRHKLEQDMSNECRDQVYRRQKLGWQDYKASGIVISCRNEIKKYKCRRGVSASDKHVRLSQILLCLENEYHKRQEINGDCLDEIKQHRKSLMDDYSVTPELLSACTLDKQKFCADKGIHGKTLHCLMAHAQNRQNKEQLTPQCMAELGNLLKISDISNDWRVDPVLQQNCQKVVERSSCSSSQPNKVMECLMNLLTMDSGADGNVMTDECETTLIQIQYFLARDFPMDSTLFDICEKDAIEVCKAKADWSDDPRKMDPSRGPLILSCLFRNIVPEDGSGSKISKPCADKVKETMRQRALSVRLIPEIESFCMEDLAWSCSDKTKPGQELVCLQDHLDELTKECHGAVLSFTQIEMKNPTVDPFIWKYCHDIIEHKCSEDKSDDEDLFECLVEHKSEMKNKKCRVSIEHFQLIRLKEIKFSPKFKAQCESDVIRHCHSSKDHPTTAGKLVSCLSEIIREDIITDNTQRVSKGCRKQVRYLLLSKVQLENTGVGDTVYKVCSSFIDKLCPNVEHGNGRVLECLRKNEFLIPQISECSKALFSVKQEIDADPGMDAILNSECETEIKYFCHDKQEHLLQCLILNTDKPGFDKTKCGKVVRDRIIDQNKDVRLNPRLQKACKFDVPKFCKNIPPGQGRIIGCLKKVFINPKGRLTQPCRDYIEEMMERAAKDDVRYDSDLYNACKVYITSSCKKGTRVDAIDSTNESDDGETEECLKILYRNDQIKDTECKNKVAQLIQSTMIDIHTDPILNQACAVDLARHCEGVPPGEGRLLNCLLNELQDEKGVENKGFNLSVKCSELLKTRTVLYQKAGAPGRMESLQDLLDKVQVSPHRNYFLSAAMTIVGLIFIFGLFCGRATKRKAVLKNK